MNTKGRHLILEFFDCDSEILKDIDILKDLIQRAAYSVNANIVASVFHPFCPNGVTGVLVLEESHLSIHTWPEHNYASVDFYTCGDCKPQDACSLICLGLKSHHYERMLIDRGEFIQNKDMKIKFHDKCISQLNSEKPSEIKVSRC